MDANPFRFLDKANAAWFDGGKVNCTLKATRTPSCSDTERVPVEDFKFP